METKVNYTVVGAFVLCLTIAIVLAIIWLSAGLTHAKYSSYAVYMDEAVTGLNVNSAVKYNGVDVGYVEDIRINRKDLDQVKLILAIEEETPITEGTTATLTSQGLTGVAYVALQGSTTDTNPLTAKPGEKYPVIRSVPSLFARLDVTVSQLSTNLNKVSDRLNELLDEDNQKEIKQTLKSLNQVSQTLATNNKQLATIIQNTAQASSQFPAMMIAGKNAMQMFSNQTLPKADRAMDNLNQASENLLNLSSEIQENPALLIRGQTPPPLGPGER